MRKADIVDSLVYNQNFTRSQAINAVEGVFKTISESLEKGESVYIRGFATIKCRKAAAKIARNISTSSPIHVPEHNTANLILCPKLQQNMNK